MALLNVVKGPTPGQQFPLVGECSVIGRHPNCDIVLEVGAISRRHAQVLFVDGEYYVEDLKSRNGTFVNDEVIAGRHKLSDGDEVKICDLIFKFHHTGTVPVEGSPDSTWAMMVDDEDHSSTIMSKIDVSSSSVGVRVTVNPEVKLKALLEITSNLANALELDEVLPKILESLFKVFVQADRGFIVLQQGDAGPLVPKAVKYRRDEEGDTVRISTTVVRQVMSSKEAILSADAATDPKFAMSESIADFRIRSLMCAPLVASEGRPLGVIQIDTLDQRSRFQEDDLEVLASVASQAAFAVENAQLHQQALEQQALQRDLALARTVQQGFLPTEPPEFEGYEFFDFYEAANQVGGDFFDYVPLPGNRLAVFVADVSGKGVSAALLMAKVSAEARYWLASEPSPAAAINRLSSGFGGHGWDDRFVTLVLAVVNHDTHEVTLVNAGHMPPLLRKPDGSVEEVAEEITGVPLGVDPDWEYEEYTFQMPPGGILTAFTDGFSEAENGQRDMYGLEALAKQVAGPAESAGQLGQRILDSVKAFVGDWRQSDDMCLLCFGRKAE